MDLYKDISSSRIHLGEVTLFESILHREGPEYVALEKFPMVKKELPRQL